MNKMPVSVIMSMIIIIIMAGNNTTRLHTVH